jgi:hypothetical protein
LLSSALSCYILTEEVEQKWNKFEGGRMARILTRKGKRKTSYTVTVRVKGFDSLSRTFDTKGEARTWAAEIESKMKNQRFKDPRRAQQTLSDALDRYIETITSQKALTTQEREKRIAKILKEKLGRNTLLPDITPSVVAKYRDQRLEVVSAYAVRLELALLSHLFLKACKEWELPLENPVNGQRFPKEEFYFSKKMKRFGSSRNARLVAIKCSTPMCWFFCKLQ